MGLADSFKNVFQKKDDDVSTSNVDNDVSETRISKSVIRKVALKRIANIVSIVIIILTLLYVIFALSLLRIVPTNSAGFVPVKNVSESYGKFEPGKQLLVSLDGETGSSILDYAKMSIIPQENVAVVEIVSKNAGKLNWTEPDILTVNGRPTGVHLEKKWKVAPQYNNDGELIKEGEKYSSPLRYGNGPKEYKEFLNNEFIVQCIKGDCVEGDGLIVPAENIMGETLKKFTL